jgi:hypothetical protein
MAVHLIEQAFKIQYSNIKGTQKALISWNDPATFSSNISRLIIEPAKSTGQAI